MEFRYFGMDEEKEEFVIFEVDREDDINVFVWVFFGKKMDLWVAPTNRFFSYVNQSLSPFYVKEDGVEDKISKALEILEGFPKEIMDRKFEKLNEYLEEFTEEQIAELEERELQVKDEVEKAREGSGYWPWNPDEY